MIIYILNEYLKNCSTIINIYDYIIKKIIKVVIDF